MQDVVAPTYDELSALPAYCEQVVPQGFEDINGHLNIRHYVGIASEGLDESLVGLGIPMQWPNIAGQAVFTAEHHMTYLHELRTGDSLSVRVRLLGRSDRAVHALVYLVDETHQRVSFVMEEIFLHIDLETRKTSDWPADVAEQLDAQIKLDADLPFAATTSGAMALR
ncbi:thioesterase [Nocardioides jishulii]|uniref:Thioesterase n=1 Tax=Nocardioides jishulii TaxID=2575440 RepID=A0A4U2YNF0_9ACTN|nr:thioesterase [Nocardioides jishulii]TKI61311.1 thioesterase [Nocardioides jishulii]